MTQKSYIGGIHREDQNTSIFWKFDELFRQDNKNAFEFESLTQNSEINKTVRQNFI
tara:strand:+ start:11 stop:178 length:168 start_codon:yes stop_codon:yes gene_type:complete